ncbi:polysaccharide lyase beta-sandwich domain-containing protein [Streptomyces sp. NPDC005925]|uniref:polysaccharide lyase beta-sandwich domain-containing protein n=1 Tax=Streptomyces sp. NPDC005925 TaxID=3157172 RepID=UPI00340A1E0C
MAGRTDWTARRASSAPGPCPEEGRRQGGEVVLTDGTLIPTQRRTGKADRRDFSGKHRTHGLHFLALTDERVRLVWISAARPGRTHDTAARHDHVLAHLRAAGLGAPADLGFRGLDNDVRDSVIVTGFHAGDTYAYLVLPGATAAETAARAHGAGRRLTVLANTDGRQGVRDAALGFTGVNFWRAGTLGDLTATTPASVLIREAGGTATVCVSGPLRDGVAIDVTWHRPVRSVTSHDPTVQVLSTEDRVALRVTPGTAGEVHRAVVRLR